MACVRPIVSLGVVYGALVAGLVLAPALSARAQEKEWSQEQVTAIAAELASSVSDVQGSFRKEPLDTFVGDRRSRYALKQDLRLLRILTRNLASDLKEGGGHDETLSLYKRIQSVREEARQNAVRSAVTQPTLERIEKAREHLVQLSPYYDEKWVPPPLPRQ